MATRKQIEKIGLDSKLYLKKVRSLATIPHGVEVKIKLPQARYEAVGYSAGYGIKSALIEYEGQRIWVALSKLSLTPV